MICMSSLDSLILLFDCYIQKKDFYETGSGVTANAVHPGIVDTEITRHMSFANSYLASVLIRPLIWMFVKSPRQGAQTVLYAALSPDLNNVSGKYFR